MARTAIAQRPFDGCIADAEKNIDSDFSVSVKGRLQSERKAHENTRKSLTEKVNAQGQRIAELEAELQNARRMEGQARKEAAEDKIALEKAKGKDPPGQRCRRTYHYAAESRPTKPPKKHFTTRTGWRQRLKNSVPVGASNSAKETSTSTARPRLMRCACWVRWETLEARKMTIDELRILRGLSLTKLCEAAGLSMGAIFKLTPAGRRT